MSSLHLFFRDYTGAFFAAALIFLAYVAIVLPSSWGKWIQDLFRLHGQIEIDGKVLYAKSWHDLATVGVLASALLALRYFLSNTLFRILARGMGIRNSFSQPQIEHKCQVGEISGNERQEQAWMVLYYTFSFSAGITMVRKYIGFTLNNVWLEYPQIYYPWDFKLFYLVQCAFYVSLIVIVLIEVGINEGIDDIETPEGFVGNAFCRNEEERGIRMVIQIMDDVDNP